MKQREKIRSLFLSDVHLGCHYCKAVELLDFLKTVEPETLYLVGDIIDGWKMQRGVYWNDTYSFIVRRIIGMMKTGTKVVYIAGNHDEFLRKFLPSQFGHFELQNEYIHTTIDGRRLLVIHGDIFDAVTKNTKFLYFLGDRAYVFSMWLNTVFNHIRNWFGLPYWSLSAMLKKNVKKAVNFINDFEKFTVKYTKEKNCDGVICGHIHTPAIKQIDNVEYFNCGDWVESCTAIVEYFDGRIELINYVEKVNL